MSSTAFVPLRELADLKSGGTPSKSREDYWDGDIPWISGKTLHHTFVKDSDLRLTEAGLHAGSNLAPVDSSLILVRGMSLLQEIRIGMVTRPVAFNQDVKAVVARPTVRPRYLNLALRAAAPVLLTQVHQAGHGTGVLATDRLTDLPIWVPPLEEQERIAGVLGAFDDLVETNRRLASKMRTTAQAESRRALTGRARTVPLTDVAIVDKGYSYKSAELTGQEMVLLNLKNAGRGGQFRRDGFKPLFTTRHKPGHVVQPGDVIVAMTDLTQDRDIIARPLRVQAPSEQVEIVASLDLAVVRPREGSTREYIWAVLSDPAFRSHALGYCSGTTVLHMKGTALSEYLVQKPDQQLINHLSETVEPLLGGADEVDLEADALVAQRDELLPLLMSGRVRVRDGEAAVS